MFDIKYIKTPKATYKYESQEQRALIELCDSYLADRRASTIFAIPNGGKRNAFEAMNLKRQGVRSGIPDLFLPVQNSEYNGLFIELKVGSNKPHEHQKLWLDQLFRQSFDCIVAYSAMGAFNYIIDYLKK
jgi:VRR-NUC domain